MKQNKKAKICFVIHIAGEKKILFYIYDVIVKQKIYKRSTNHYWAYWCSYWYYYYSTDEAEAPPLSRSHASYMFPPPHPHARTPHTTKRSPLKYV